MNEILSKPTLRVFQEHLVSYSTVRQIEEFFEDAGLSVCDGYNLGEQSVRRNLVQQYYKSVNLENWTDVNKLLKAFEGIIHLFKEDIQNSTTPESQKQLERLLEHLKRDNFTFKDSKIIFTGDFDILKSQAVINEDYPLVVSDLFKYQFPAGLPFGLTKPNFAIISEKGSQKLHFEINSGMGILKQDVYPSFTFQKLAPMLEETECSNSNIKKLLIDMNQTESKKNFFLAYAKTFEMATKNIPVLIPQAWMQWHSLPKRNLRADNSAHADNLYRVDFVAFWNNKRFAILIDDIGHYAKNNSNLWKADEETYSKRLKEDRKLRKESWQVFRVSNWEIRNNEVISEILEDLREFIGFDLAQ